MRALGFQTDKTEVARIIKEYDHTGKKLISYDDFFKVSMYFVEIWGCEVMNLTFVVSKMILARDPVEEIKRAFTLFDTDGTGKISFEDLKRVSTQLGENLEDDEIRAMIDVFDFDQDGQIDEEEFLDICLNH